MLAAKNRSQRRSDCRKSQKELVSPLSCIWTAGTFSSNWGLFRAPFLDLLCWFWWENYVPIWLSLTQDSQHLKKITSKVQQTLENAVEFLQEK